MTEYADIPRINMLHQEKERVLTAIEMLETHGTMTSFVVVPPPASEGGPIQPSVGISTQGTALSIRFLRDLHAWCVQRSTDIDAELATLGVTETPPTPEPPA